MGDFEIFFDGASQGNPGPSGAGALLKSEGTVKFTISKYLGKQTNNFAEYQSLILGLEETIRRGVVNHARYSVKGDSELVVKQVTGEWRVDSESLRPLHARAADLLRRLGNLANNKPVVTWVERAGNAEADELAAKAVKTGIAASSVAGGKAASGSLSGSDGFELVGNSSSDDDAGVLSASSSDGEDVALPSGQEAELARLTKENMKLHNKLSEPKEPHQFVCLAHGSFWKNARPSKPIASCRRCRAAGASDQECLLDAVPRADERGLGAFKCPSCGGKWRSNAACRSWAQYCQGPAIPGTSPGGEDGKCNTPVYPAAVKPPLPPHIMNRRRPRSTAGGSTMGAGGGGGHEEGYVGYGAYGGGGGGGYGGGGGDGGGGGGGGGFGGGGGGGGDYSGGGGGGGDDAGSVSSARVARSAPPRGGSRAMHSCSGCASGACRSKQAPSRIHVSTGSTRTGDTGSTMSGLSSFSMASSHTGSIRP